MNPLWTTLRQWLRFPQTVGLHLRNLTLLQQEQNALLRELHLQMTGRRPLRSMAAVKAEGGPPPTAPRVWHSISPTANDQIASAQRQREHEASTPEPEPPISDGADEILRELGTSLAARPSRGSSSEKSSHRQGPTGSPST